VSRRWGGREGYRHTSREREGGVDICTIHRKYIYVYMFLVYYQFDFDIFLCVCMRDTYTFASNQKFAYIPSNHGTVFGSCHSFLCALFVNVFVRVRVHKCVCMNV